MPCMLLTDSLNMLWLGGGTFRLSLYEPQPPVEMPSTNWQFASMPNMVWEPVPHELTTTASKSFHHFATSSLQPQYGACADTMEKSKWLHTHLTMIHRWALATTETNSGCISIGRPCKKANLADKFTHTSHPWLPSIAALA